MIQAALVEQQGRVVDAARQLGVSRATLYKNWRNTGWADTKADARPGENPLQTLDKPPVATNNQEFYLAPASSRTAGHPGLIAVMSEPTAPDLAAQLQAAIAHHQAGELAEAEQGYRAILAEQANHPDAWHNLGILALQVENSTTPRWNCCAALQNLPSAWSILDQLFAGADAHRPVRPGLRRAGTRPRIGPGRRTGGRHRPPTGALPGAAPDTPGETTPSTDTAAQTDTRLRKKRRRQRKPQNRQTSVSQWKSLPRQNRWRRRQQKPQNRQTSVSRPKSLPRRTATADSNRNRRT